MMTQGTLFDRAEMEIRNRVDLAFKGQLTDSERAVLKTLMVGPAFGQLYMISIAFMQASWSTDGAHVYRDREVKRAIKNLIEMRNIPIGSSRMPGMNGYWLIVSDREAEEAARPLKNEIISMYRRLRIISPKSSFVKILHGQMQILEEEMKQECQPTSI